MTLLGQLKCLLVEGGLVGWCFSSGGLEKPAKIVNNIMKIVTHTSTHKKQQL